MARVKVMIEIEVPEVGATDEQIGEWLAYELHYNGSMELSNPLSSESFDTDDLDWEYA